MKTRPLTCRLGLHKYDAIPTRDFCLRHKPGLKIEFEVVCVRCGHCDDFNIVHRIYELLKNVHAKSI